jgi:hypothetical protein
MFGTWAGNSRSIAGPETPFGLADLDRSYALSAAREALTLGMTFSTVNGPDDLAASFLRE